jgi:aminomuconate-semialdehyde/2-hydroxymuconate-6-semialdehyde dehydrogenase
MQEIRHFVDGQFVPSANGATFDDVNPATGEVIAKVFEGGREEIDRAVKAARRALPQWAALAQEDRSRLLVDLAKGIERRFDDFLLAEVKDTGKPISLARHLDIPRGSANFNYFAEHFKYVDTAFWENKQQNALNYALRRPVGVVGIISPWNLPLLLTTWKAAPALAAGNCVVIKPSEETPATATLLAEVCNEVGIPKGVCNVVHGFGPESAGEFLVGHPDVDAITFTGETATGKAIMRAAADGLKKLSFELGGKNPNIVFADADLEVCLETTLRSSFANQGEVCLSGSRLYVERPILNRFLDMLLARIEETTKLGDPMDPETTMGSLISRTHLERVMAYVESARADGAVIHCGGEEIRLPGKLAQGAFYAPTVMTDLKPESKAQKEEIFGPVVSVTPFEDEDQALKLANGTRYGLSATVWTSNLSRAHRVAAALDVGIVWINTWFLRDLRSPFGGMKESGIGREGGVYSLDFYTELKNVCVKL